MIYLLLLAVGGVSRPGREDRPWGWPAAPIRPRAGAVGRLADVTVYQLVVDVMLKPEILDPAGQAVANALPNLGFPAPVSLRIGRHVALSVEAADSDGALEAATKIAETLLANPVIEDYTVRLA